MWQRPAMRHSEVKEISVMASSLVSFSNELASVVEKTAASVVAVHARPRFNSSGVHWSPGVVVTADQTLYHDEEIFVTTASGEKFAAEIVGRDPGTDLAVLRVKDLAVPRSEERRVGKEGRS